MSKCCVECFRDSRVRAFVSENGSQRGCEFCHREGETSIDPAALAPMFEEVMGCFELEAVASPVGANLPSFPSTGQPLADLIQRRLQIFGEGPRSEGPPPVLRLSRLFAEPWQHALLTAIVSARDGRTLPLEQRWVFKGPRHANLSAVGHWDRFSTSLLKERRFIPSYTAGEVEMRKILEEALLLSARQLDNSIALFRARIGCEPGDLASGALLAPLPLSELGAPPFTKTRRGGRVNPPGIPVLYLASDADTAVCEVRPYVGAYVSICSWTVDKPVLVADLSNVEPPDTVFGHEDLAWHLECRELLEELSLSFALPIDPNDWSTQYVPTQYAAEVIRDMGFGGVGYQSVYGTGVNIALFDERAAKAAIPVLRRVTGLTYETKPMPNLPGLFT